MTTRDKVAMILTKYGYSIEEGFSLYDKSIADKDKYLVHIDIDNDLVLWLEEDKFEEGAGCYYVTVWTKYKKTFCLSYAIAGAVALDDEDLAVTDEEDKALLIEYLKNCHEEDCHCRPMPMLPERLHWLFTSAGTEDFVDADHYSVQDNTTVNVEVVE